MKKALIAYFSRMGNTRKMADDLAEGLRFSGTAVKVKSIGEIKSENSRDRDEVSAERARASV